jgi:hypothetical protein
MRLTDDQLSNLISLLTPKFEDVEARKTALAQAFPGDSAAINITLIDDVSSEVFTSALITELSEKQVHTQNGELALAKLLAAVQFSQNKDRTFVMRLQPYINVLKGSSNGEPAAAAVATAAEGETAVASPTKKRHRRRRNPLKRAFNKTRKYVRLPLIIAIVLIAVIVPTASTLVLATDAQARVLESFANLKRVVSSLGQRNISDLTEPDLDRLQFALDEMYGSLNRASSQTVLLKTFASSRADVRASLGMLDTGQEIVAGARDMLSGLRPSLFYLMQTSDKRAPTAQISTGERLVEQLSIGRAQFISADTHLSVAQQRLNSLDLSNMPPSFLLNIQEMGRYLTELQNVNSILRELPDLLNKAFGLDTPTNYLILSANSDEIRPSGGYLSTYGWMRIRRLRVADYGYNPSTALTPNPPPASLANDLNIPAWWSRFLPNSQPITLAWDGSWTPDFPTTAKMAAMYYNEGNNPRSPVGGVIQIDMVGFEYILQALGKVTVPEYDDTITADNFRERIYHIRETGEGDLPHKKYLASLYKQVLNDWQNATQEGNEKLFSALLKALSEKHIMVYFEDPSLNKVVRLLDWDGVQKPAKDHDYLMFVDTNVGSKSTRSVRRQITYDVEIQPDGSLKSRASAAYDFSAQVAAQDPAYNPKNYSNPNYFNILQVFVPAGSKLVETKNLQQKLDTEEDDNHTNFITLTEIKYDGTERFQFSYTTPSLIEPYGPYWRYRLLIQKQPGMLPESVIVQITMPPNASIVSATPEIAATYNLGQAVLEFRRTLSTDQWIEIIFKK